MSFDDKVEFWLSNVKRRVLLLIKRENKSFQNAIKHEQIVGLTQQVNHALSAYQVMTILHYFIRICRMFSSSKAPNVIVQAHDTCEVIAKKLIQILYIVCSSFRWNNFFPANNFFPRSWRLSAQHHTPARIQNLNLLRRKNPYHFNEKKREFTSSLLLLLLLCLNLNIWRYQRWIFFENFCGASRLKLRD